ncbi:MAG: putative molybdopterin biosynthesis protein moaD [Pseudomonadota bacterium]|jgi:molybdopterin synthase sulfur carrier subunit
MKIKVKLFGNCKDIFKNSALYLNFNKKIKVKDIRNKLIEIIEIKHSTNKSYKDLIKKSAFCSEQDEIVNDSYVLKKDKIISIIPPIGGG